MGLNLYEGSIKINADTYFIDVLLQVFTLAKVIQN